MSASENLSLYLSKAVLPPMKHSATAPFMPHKGHKAHRNHIAIRPEPYRSRFTKIIWPKDRGVFDNVVLEFVKTLPARPLGLPDMDEATGFALTVPAPGFAIPQMCLQHPATIREVAPWVAALPLQTMARALHVAFPRTRGWDVTYLDGDRLDAALWNTLVWRKTPPPPDPERLWLALDPCGLCSVVFVVQPPWILTPQDFKSFMTCTSLPPFDTWDPSSNPPFTSAERIWAKLWDTCVRKGCHRWVLSTYSEWAFGAFTEGFTAGQVLDFKTHDAKEPTIIECLVYQVASSMGLVEGSKLPQYFETMSHAEWDMEVPEPAPDLAVDCPDSGSEWDGMHDEPGISAGVSSAGHLALSRWGSEQSFRPAPAPGPGATAARRASRRPLLAPARVVDVVQWQHRIDDGPPPYEREVSPAASETGQSTAGILAALERGGSEVPDVQVVRQDEPRGFGGYLATVVEQGPDDGSVV